MKTLSLIAVALLATCAAIIVDPLEVNTNNGRVGGKLLKPDSDSPYVAYKCIPYARAPVGQLRFKAPQPSQDWEGVLREDTCKMCPQIDFLSESYIGDEDCLNLNVYKPANPTTSTENSLLPVMVFIFGGEWKVDFADRYTPEFFMKDKKVMMVTLNYRMGPLGFLSTGDKVVSGNNGLKDQSLALKWVQDNIRSFGGDPDKVTIFGTATGAASVRYHMLSPMSEGLFAGAIAQSGNELDTWAWSSQSESVSNFEKLSAVLHCADNDVTAAVDCLKECSAEDIVRAEEYDFIDDRRRGALVSTFKPVTEVHTEDAFLCKNPVEMLKNGEGFNVPLIIGLNENEGAYKYVEFWLENKLDVLEQNLEWILPTSSPAWRLEDGDRQTIVDRIRTFYLLDDSTDSVQLRTNLINLLSDALFLQGHNTLLSLHNPLVSSPVYQYIITYRGQRSYTDWLGYPEDLGSTNYDQELYIFPSELYFEDELNQDSKDMVNRIIELWTNFAINQEPTPTSDHTVNWLPASIGAYKEYLDIAGPNELTMKSNFHLERAEFWRNLENEFGAFSTAK